MNKSGMLFVSLVMLSPAGNSAFADGPKVPGACAAKVSSAFISWLADPNLGDSGKAKKALAIDEDTVKDNMSIQQVNDENAKGVATKINVTAYEKTGDCSYYGTVDVLFKGDISNQATSCDIYGIEIDPSMSQDCG